MTQGTSHTHYLPRASIEYLIRKPHSRFDIFWTRAFVVNVIYHFLTSFHVNLSHEHPPHSLQLNSALNIYSVHIIGVCYWFCALVSRVRDAMHFLLLLHTIKFTALFAHNSQHTHTLTIGFRIIQSTSEWICDSMSSRNDVSPRAKRAMRLCMKCIHHFSIKITPLVLLWMIFTWLRLFCVLCVPRVNCEVVVCVPCYSPLSPFSHTMTRVSLYNTIKYSLFRYSSP